MEDVFREKGLIEGKYYFSGSPGFWEEIDFGFFTFYLGGEYAGAVYLMDGRWEAYVCIPASLLIGKGSTEQVQHLISSRKKVEAKKAVVDFYKKVLRDERYI